MRGPWNRQHRVQPPLRGFVERRRRPFCTSTAAGHSASTIGDERRTNPVLQHKNADDFVAHVLTDLAPYPSYYAHMGPINVLGPGPEPKRVPPILAIEDIPDDSQVIDVRAKPDFAAGHLPASIGIPAGDQTGVWTGWLVDFGTRLVLVADRKQDTAEIVTQLARIGYDDVIGVVHDLGSVELVAYRSVDVDTFVDALDTDHLQVLDVRAPSEWSAGHVDGSTHRYLPDIRQSDLDLEKDREVWVACGSGYRATIAAGLIEQAGYTPVVLSEAGVTDVLTAKAKTRSQPAPQSGF